MPVNLKYLAFVVLALNGVGLTGCATLNPAPYADFSRAVQQAQASIDNAVSVNQDWVRQGFVGNFKGKFSDLLILPGQGYTWKMRELPLHLSLRQAGKKLNNLNSVVAQYADLLAKLAGSETVKEERFIQLAKELNANAGSAAAALQIEVAPDQRALFSTAALELLRLYLENRRQDALAKIIEKHQPVLDAYAQACISLIHNLRAALKNYYPENVEPLRARWKSARGAQKQAIAAEMLVLNEKFVSALEMLEELEAAYRSLPLAHAELRQSVRDAKVKWNQEGLKRLQQSAHRLQRWYQDVKKAKP